MRKLDYNSTGPRAYLQQAVQTVVIPSPTGGWNFVLPLQAMSPQYAHILDNWVPRTGWVELRPGYNAWAQSLSTSAVESLMTYRPAGNEKLFAATNGSIYDVTTEGTFTQVQTGLGSNRWQYINFTPAQGANYIYLVNGQDNPRYFDGTNWTQPSITDGPSPSTFVNIASWKRRIWFVEGNSTRAWYLPTDAVQGSLLTSGNPNVVDIGSLVMKGGKLVAIGTLTVDGGNGPDDLICFITARGEVVIYKGTDPTNANAFSEQGVFYIAPPLGNRCTMDNGADLAIITTKGVIPLSQALPLDVSAVRGAAITNNIQEIIRTVASTSQNNFGWELSHFPAQDLIILNVPINQGSGQQQYVQNGETGAWCRFTGWQANCFAIFQDSLYFGDNKGNVNQAWMGAADLVSPIVADMQCAFNYFGDPGRIKQITMVQPMLTTSGTVTPTLGFDVDFGSTSPTALVQSATPTGAQFGSAVFGTSTFAVGTSQQTLWQGAQGQGKALALRMKVNLLPSGPGGSSVFDTGVFDTMVFDGFGSNTSTLQLNMANAMMKFGGSI